MGPHDQSEMHTWTLGLCADGRMPGGWAGSPGGWGDIWGGMMRGLVGGMMRGLTFGAEHGSCTCIQQNLHGVHVATGRRHCGSVMA